MKLFFIISIITVVSLLGIRAQNVEMVTGTIYVNNNFTFYINGELIAKDPVESAPHNAYNVSFNVSKNQDITYGITGIDLADPNTGLELNNRCLGSGGMRAIFSNGVETNSSWKCWTSFYGPVNWQSCYAADERNGSIKVLPLCNQDGVPPFTGCYTFSRTVAQDWNLPTFDDSNWENAIEWNETSTIYGLRPTGCEMSNTYISSQTDVNGDNMTCPEWVNWGTSRFIWREDLALDNTIHCRYTVRVASVGQEDQQECNSSSINILSASITFVVLSAFLSNMAF